MMCQYCNKKVKLKQLKFNIKECKFYHYNCKMKNKTN